MQRLLPKDDARLSVKHGKPNHNSSTIEVCYRFVVGLSYFIVGFMVIIVQLQQSDSNVVARYAMIYR